MWTSRETKLHFLAMVAVFFFIPVAVSVAPLKAFGFPSAATEFSTPLTAEEKTLIEGVVQTDRGLDEILETSSPRRICLMYSVAHEHNHDRLASVLLYAPVSGLGAEELVDLTKQMVISRSKLPSRNIPLAPKDVDDAIKIITADPRLQHKFQDTPHDYYQFFGTLVRGTVPDDPCFSSRCVSVTIRHEEQYIPASLVVDLKTKKVEIDWQDVH